MVGIDEQALQKQHRRRVAAIHIIMPDRRLGKADHPVIHERDEIAIAAGRFACFIPPERRPQHQPSFAMLRRGGRDDYRLSRNRNATDLAWAGNPSAWASATVAGPSSFSAVSVRPRKLVRFMKSSTDNPLAKRARRPVGRT